MVVINKSKMPIESIGSSVAMASDLLDVINSPHTHDVEIAHDDIKRLWAYVWQAGYKDYEDKVIIQGDRRKMKITHWLLPISIPNHEQLSLCTDEVCARQQEERQERIYLKNNPAFARLIGRK